MSTFDTPSERSHMGLSDPPGNGLDPALRSAGKLQGLLGEVAHLVTAAATLSGEDLAQAKAKLSEHLVEVRRALSQLSGQVGERARGMARATDGYVRERPWRALAIGTATGLVLGLFFARRR